MTEPTFTQADIDAAIAQTVDKTLSEVNAKHAEEMRILRESFAPALATPVPGNSGGIGTNIEQTWSLHDQTMAARGEHPLQNE